MIEVRFKNSYGEITLGGGNHPLYRILALDGLTMPDVTRNTAKYYGEPGQELLYRQVDSRTITMSIDIVNRGNPASDLIKMQKVLSSPGKLVIRSLMRSRAIEAECISFNPDIRNQAYQKLILQFVCDNPYFQDEENTVEYLYTVNNLLKGTFTLPAVFSQRINKKIIHNKGDIKTEPVIHLFASDEQANPGAEELITVRNHTTGQFMKINHEFSNNETLSVDVPQRRLYSSIEPEKPLYCITDDTYLSDFCLATGDNEIEVISDTSRHISVTVEFNNNYREAVV